MSRSRVASRQPARLQPVAQRHQFIDLGDDAVLLGERWKTNRDSLKHSLLQSRHGSARLISSESRSLRADKPIRR